MDIQLTKKDSKISILSAALPLLGLVFVIVLFSALTGGQMLQMKNLSIIINQAFTVCLIAIGGIFVYAHGGMDFSISGLVCLNCVVTGIMLQNGISPVLAVLTVLAMGILSGTLVGGVSVYLKIPVFLASLAVQYILKGIGESSIQGKVTIYIPAYFSRFFNNWGFRITVLAAVFLLGWYLFNRTKVGKYQKAIGGNETVAALSGVNTRKYIILSHILLGLCASVASIFSVAKSGAVAANSGAGLELDVLVALVLGGMPLSGGCRARIRAAVLGALTVTALQNGLTLVGVDASIVEGITGVLFIVCVAFTFVRKPGDIVK